MEVAVAETLGPGAGFAGWRIVRLLGQGALGRVYLAESADRVPIALKLLTAAAAAPDFDAARFEREVESLGRLAHEGIVRLLASGWHEGVPYLATEYVMGCDLADSMAQEPRWAEQRAAALAVRIAEALAHAHRRGVVHRDIKPSNILLENGDPAQARIADFGIASMDDAYRSHTGVFAGTPAYMAPEQLLGAPASARADLYSLGVVLYELLAGERPHRADSLGDLLRRVAHDTPLPVARHRPDLSAVLTATIGSLLQPDPSARASDAAAVARTLAPLVQMRPPLAGR